jgi:O-antigen/teichoic acid export membrane protein
MSARRSILHTLSLATVFRLVRLALSFGLTCLLARHLGRSGFGEIGVAMAVVSILVCFGELGFGRYTVRELVRLPDEQADVLGNTILARVIVSVVLFAGLMLWIILARPEGAILLSVYALQLLTHPSTEVFAWLEANDRVKSMVTAQFTGFLVSAACIAVGIWMQAPLWFFAFTYALEGWIFIVLCGVVFRQNGGRVRFGAFRWSRALQLVSRSWPELASQAALLLLFRLDIAMIQWLRGSEEAGVYSAAVRVSEMAYFVPGVLATLFLPRLMASRQNEPEYHRRVVDYLSASVVLALVVAIGLWVAAPLLPLAFGSEYERSATMLAVHAWAFIPYAVGVARTQILTVEDRLAANLSSVVLAVVINAALNLVWIPAHGGLGAAWATLTAYSAAWVLGTYLSPGLRTHVSGFLTRAVMGLPRFTLLQARSLLRSS